MVEVEVRSAQVEDYAALAEIEELGVWRSLPSPMYFPDEMAEYTVAVVDGRVWGFLAGHHDSDAWAACELTSAPPADWTVSMVSNLLVHPTARGHGLGAALLRDFFRRAARTGSEWVMIHPAECGGGRLSSGMSSLCARAGLRLVEPKARPGKRAKAPSLMAAPLRPSPTYAFVPAAVAAPAPAPARSTRPVRVPVAA